MQRYKEKKCPAIPNNREFNAKFCNVERFGFLSIGTKKASFKKNLKSFSIMKIISTFVARVYIYNKNKNNESYEN